MDCKEFENGLDDFLEGRMSRLHEQAARAHLTTCASCELLVEVARGNLEDLAESGPKSDPSRQSAGPPPDLTDAVLARTSGKACARAQPLLFDLAEASLEAGEAQLVELHTEHCARCQTLLQTMYFLRDTLPQMAALEPDPKLVSDIVQATSGAGIRHPSIWSEVRSWWRRLVARPRFTWEAAYVGTLVLVALFGTSYSPLRDVTPRALAVVQINPVAAVRDATSAIPKPSASALWDASGQKLLDGAQKRGDDFVASRPGLPEAMEDLRSHTRLLRQALARRDLALGSVFLRRVGTDLATLWKSLKAEPQPETPVEPGVEDERRFPMEDPNERRTEP